MRFSVFRHIIEMNGQEIRRYFIVLVNDDNLIIGWTLFGQFCEGPHSVKNIASDDKCRIDAVCRFLNYAFFEKKLLKKLSDITPDMFRQYLTDYCSRQLSSDTPLTHRSQSTMNREINFLMDFGIALAKSGVAAWKEDALYHTRTVYNNKKHRHIEVKESAFTVKTMPKERRKILRDLPDVVFRYLIDYIIKNEPDIMMLAALSAFAGLRPSEACNVRREDSALGAGISFELIDGEVNNVTIDLTEEKVLRSDGVSVGGIKRTRKQKVYLRFLDTFVEIYNMYMTHIKDRKYEAEYGPLTTARNGKAMTYQAYLHRFQTVVHAATKKMVLDTDPLIAKWGQILQQQPIAPHIFRHWFSTRLADYGENLSMLQYWRGDKTPEAAMTYLQNKSDLTKQQMTVGSQVVQYQLWLSEKENDADKGKEHTVT